MNRMQYGSQQMSGEHQPPPSPPATSPASTTDIGMSDLPTLAARPSSTSAVIHQIPLIDSPVFYGTAVSEGQRSNYSGTLADEDEERSSNGVEAHPTTAAKKPSKRKQSLKSLQNKLERKYVCHICYNAFGLQNVLNVHMRIHTGEKPFQCKICHKRFNQSGSLNRHLKTHNRHRNHRCELCSFEFIHLSQLRRHEREVHGVSGRSVIRSKDQPLSMAALSIGAATAEEPRAPLPHPLSTHLPPPSSASQHFDHLAALPPLGMQPLSSPPQPDPDIPVASARLNPLQPMEVNGLNNLLRSLPPLPPLNGFPQFPMSPRGVQMPDFLPPPPPAPALNLSQNSVQPAPPFPFTMTPPVDHQLVANNTAMLAAAASMLKNARSLGGFPNIELMLSNITSMTNENHGSDDFPASLTQFFTPQTLEYFMKFTDPREIPPALLNLMMCGGLLPAGGCSPQREISSSASSTTTTTTTQGPSSSSESVIGISPTRVSVPTAVSLARLPISSDGKRCNLCDKKFTCTSALRIHYRKHSGERPFSCNYCRKSFSQKGTLMRHHNTCKAANGRPPPESCTSSPQSRQQQRQAQQQELPSVPRRVNGYQKQPTGENHANGQHREGQSRDANPPILEETLRRLIAGRMQQPPTTTHSNDSRQHQLPSPSTPLRRPLTLAHDLLPSDSISPKRPEPGCADDAPEDLSKPKAARYDGLEGSSNQPNGCCIQKASDNVPSIDNLYKCQPCGIFFVDVQLYRLHISLHGTGGDFACSVCRCRWENAVEFSSHFVRNHHTGLAPTDNRRQSDASIQSPGPNKYSPSKIPNKMLRQQYAANSSYNIQNLSLEMDPE